MKPEAKRPAARTLFRRADLLAAGIVGVLTLAVFLPAISGDFVLYDVRWLVLENPQVMDGLDLSDVGWSLTTDEYGFPKPLTFLSLALDVSLFGPGPTGFHLTNVLLHVANTVLVFGFFFRAKRNLPLAVVAALFWGLHPMRVESVAWVVERKDVLSGLFALLAFHAWLSWGRHRHWR
ncbi:MAG: hypothetical protein R3336_06995, partial [Phycisphaeraceae bacterium]|nr:hypothetical protein [Phycisphaeraceae bacterium]